MKNIHRPHIQPAASSFLKSATLLALAGAAVSLVLEPASAFAQRPLGVDVSSYQGGGINWTSVKGSGVSFAWAKATEGVSINDADFVGNINNGKAAGVYMGAYHFAHPNDNSPGSEAGHFWGVAGGYIKADGKTYMPMLDMEVFSGVVGASSYSDWANQFNNDIVADASGNNVKIRPFVYTSACSACNFNNSIAGWLADIADYNGENLYTGTPWSTCTGCEVWGSGVWNVWQVSSTGAISGIPGNVDLDGFNGTLSSMVGTAVATAKTSAGESLGGVFTSGIACCSWAVNRLDLLGVGTDGAIYHKWWDGSAWQPSATGSWQQLPFGTGWHGDIGAVSWGSGRIDFFVQGTDNHCHHGWYTTAGGWQGMEDRVGVFAPSIGFGAASWASGRLDIFGVGINASNLFHSSYSSAGWSGWEDLGGTITSTPGAVSWDVNRIDVFGRGTDGACHQIFWNGSWNGFVTLGGGFENYGMGAASMTSGLLNVIGVGGSANIYELDFTGTWDSWQNISAGPSTSTTSAVSWGPNRLDIFYRGSDNACHHLWSD